MKFFICSGMGDSEYELTAFDSALENAGIENFNLVKISSILPCNTREASSQKLKNDLEEGSFLHTAFAKITSCTPDEVIGTCVAVAIPKEKDHIGVIMELSDRSLTKTPKKMENELREKAFLMCKEGMDRRKIGFKEIKVSSITKKIDHPEKYTALVSAITIWDKKTI